MAPHDVLGVRPGATEREVRAAFRHYARHHHPDRGGDPQRFQAGLDAYQDLLGRPASPARTADVVFHRRRRGLAMLTRPWRSRRERRQRPPRVT